MVSLPKPSIIELHLCYLTEVGYLKYSGDWSLGFSCSSDYVLGTDKFRSSLGESQNIDNIPTSSKDSIECNNLISIL